MSLKNVPSRPQQVRGQYSGAAVNQTLYVNGLNDKIKKPDLRKSLYLLFTTYGSVLDVVALKTMKARGQAHIVFKDVQSAAAAQRALNGTMFYGKEMKIQYAKSKSITIAKLDGSFKIPTGATSGEQQTNLQASIFGAPPAVVPAAASTSAPAPSANENEKDVPHGVKRTRDEEEDAVEQEEDGDSAMEESDEDD